MVSRTAFTAFTAPRFSVSKMCNQHGEALLADRMLDSEHAASLSPWVQSHCSLCVAFIPVSAAGVVRALTWSLEGGRCART